MLSALLLLSLACNVYASAKTSPPRLRADLQQKTHLFCTAPRGLHSLWQAGVYDTLLSLHPLPRAQEAARARTQAQREGSAGYAYGSCADGRGWALSVSAPYAALRTGHKVKLAAALKHYCRGLQARYAPSGWQRTSTLPITKHKLLLPARDNGIAAVNCLPLQPHKTGPRLLYIFPVGQPTQNAPLLPQKTAPEHEHRAVQTWVSALRVKMGLAALPLYPMPTTTQRFSVIHDRAQLRALKHTLQQQDQRLLGENRARGPTLNAALTMLWLSPFHRDLLLHDQATALMLAIERQHQQVLVSMYVSTKLMQVPQ